MKESVLLQKILDEERADRKKERLELQQEISRLKGEKKGKPAKQKPAGDIEPVLSAEQAKAYEARLGNLTKQVEDLTKSITEKDLEIGDLKTSVGELEGELEGARAAAEKGKK